MLISLFLLLILTASGLALTYLFDDDSPLLTRLAAGNVLGSALFGTVTFGLALALGLTTAVAVAGLVIAAIPLVLFYSTARRKRFDQDRARAAGRLQGANGRKFLRFAYYAFFFLLFFFFFDRAMLESGGGIFTGGSQNLGDLPFHLGAIFSFTDGNNFPPENPSFAGARFSYPLIADFITACFMKFGANVRDAMFVQNLAWCFSLMVLLERFVLKLTDNRLAARLAAPLLIFSGGLGFIWFFGDYAAQTKSFFDFLGHLPKDYTIGSDGFRWGNSMVVMFITQRSLLLGMPLTLIVLMYLWKVFTRDDGEAKPTAFSVPAFVVGCVAGLLPLVHLHSLAVLFIVGVFLFVIRPEKWMTWLIFAVGVAVIAVPELAWSISGSATETKKFFAWHFGWDKGDQYFLLFWLLNTGLAIPLILFGVYIYSPEGRKQAAAKPARESKKKQKEAPPENVDATFSVGNYPLLFFYLPFAFCFLVSNVAKLAPWEWDNIKVLIYWFVGSIPFIALAVAWLWQKGQSWMKAIAVACFVVLIASGALDVWRTVSGQINYKVFDADAVEVAEQVKRRTKADALFLNAPTYNTAVVLTGRQSLMRYPGHLGSHGINYGERESDVKRIYQGGPAAVSLLAKYNIDYVLVSPEERNQNQVNEQFFAAYPTAAESGQYRVYKIK